MTTFLKRSLPSLVLLVGLAGGVAAQTSSKSATDTSTVVGTVSKAPQAAEALDAPVKTGVLEGTGKWVRRIDKKTCPNGSEAYVDEVNGGVKCWVNTN